MVDDLINLATCKLTQGKLQAMINEFDIDNNGTIDFIEFLKIMAKRQTKGDPINEIKEAKDAFKMLDANGNGFISSFELRHLMANLGKQMTKKEVDTMMKKVDKDGDGQINYQEFVNMMIKYQS